MQHPKTSHLQALLHTLAYIQGTMTQGILLEGADQHSLQAFSDSDCAACSSSRSSYATSSYLAHPINWKSKKQGTVSRDSSEAEY